MILAKQTNIRNLNITYGKPFIFYSSLIPESPRWLLSQGRNDDAMKIIQQISKSNNKKMLNVQFEKETNEKYGFRQTILPALKSKMLVMRLIILTTGWYVYI